ncbi:ComEC/Rec2 family competence protein [uncultured Bacteroides sp.]|jgi:competence protein ComEC|uniref:ComEC/Rec2 family competence protein n=1 Tax=uncultured Bacteroides sp. TaxID=162156 RepID=UPI0025D9D250|nr:ComEC/Rec2 family competence protein [uncultured Bacteroides sp.]
MIPFLHKYPFFRLAVPWMLGIYCGDRFSDSFSEPLWGFLACILWACLSFLFYFSERYSWRWCFGVSLSLFCLAGGWLSVNLQLKTAAETEFPKEEAVYRLRVNDFPEVRERTFLCRVWLKERHDSLGIHPVNKQAILYFQRDSLSSRLQMGEELWVRSRISPPVSARNFDEFDYARYLKRKGISGTGFVASGHWQFSECRKEKEGIATVLYRLAASYRTQIENLYRRLGIEGDELAVLSALTLGDKTDLSESVRESYSVAGVSHVLALSGLHIGLLYALAFFLLRPLLLGGQSGRVLRSLLLILLLWLFAFFTGLSPSVVRSAAMFSIWALADLCGRQSFSLNTLALTAWLMLLVRPVWLFDVGFQLSFAAVLSILLFQPFLYRLCPVRHRAGTYLWGLVSVSVAAQLGTAPLVLFYFSRFSTHFLLTNLLVVPLVTLILYAAVVLLLLTPMGGLQAVAAVGLEKMLRMLNLLVRWVEQLPYASVDGIWLYPLEVAGCYLVLGAFFCYLCHRRYARLVTALVLLAAWGAVHSFAVWTDRPRTSIVFYNVRGCPAVHCIESSGHSCIQYADSLSNRQRLRQTAANYWHHCHLYPPAEGSRDSVGQHFFRRQQLICWHGQRVCMVTDNRWKQQRTGDGAVCRVDYLYICKGYTGQLAALTRLFLPGCIILDSSLSDYRRNRLKEECQQNHLHFISLSDEGSVRFLL